MIEKWRKLMMLGAMMWLSNCYHMLFLPYKVTRPTMAIQWGGRIRQTNSGISEICPSDWVCLMAISRRKLGNAILQKDNWLSKTLLKIWYCVKYYSSTTGIITYLIFVNFGTLPHYWGLWKVHQKTQWASNKIAKIGQNLPNLANILHSLC